LKETLRHKEAFEYYYVLGEKRSYPQVAHKFTVSDRSIKKWGKAFNWQERIEQRDIEISRGLEIKTNETVISIKAAFKAEIKVQLSIFKTMLNKLIEKFKENKEKKENEIIEIKKIDDLKIVTDCYEKLVRLYLSLIGEGAEREEIALKDADEKLFNKINSIIAKEQKRKNIKRNKKSKQ
jgi:hypothetical protein